MINLATQYLTNQNETVDDWDGLCGELANEILPEGGATLWIEGDDLPWRFHMVALIDGLVHDPWCQGLPALTPSRWVREWSEPDNRIEISLNGDVVFDGDAKDFYDQLVTL